MCDLGDTEGFEMARFGWHKARKRYRCMACNEWIEARARYWRLKGKIEGDFASFIHCARCHVMWELIDREARKSALWFEGADLELSCGESWEDAFGVPAPDELVNLAFALPNELPSTATEVKR